MNNWPTDFNEAFTKHQKRGKMVKKGGIEIPWGTFMVMMRPVWRVK
ncbi:hypothetical protein [Thermoactinomyces mirandus]|nr:hypothetical protein [Thermoactinomyces mirandus]